MGDDEDSKTEKAHIHGGTIANSEGGSGDGVETALATGGCETT